MARQKSITSWKAAAAYTGFGITAAQMKELYEMGELPNSECRGRSIQISVADLDELKLMQQQALEDEVEEAPKASKKDKKSNVKEIEAKIIIPNQLSLGRIVFGVVGHGEGNGYLSNHFHPDVVAEIAAKADGSGGAKAKKVRDFKLDFQRSLRLDHEDRPCIPGAAFKRAMVRASLAAGFKMTQSNAMFQVEGSLLPILDAKPMMFRRAVKGGAIAINAMFRNEPNKPWRVELPILFDKGQTTPEVLCDLINRAGFFVGVGAWRPECSGSMGMFKMAGILR